MNIIIANMLAIIKIHQQRLVNNIRKVILMKKLLILGMAILIATSGAVFANASTDLKVSKDTVKKVEYDHEAWETKAESLGMTVEELKAEIEKKKQAYVEAYAAKAASLGMTVEELKVAEYEAWEAKAESLGMTVEELKAKLMESKKEK